MDREWYGPGFGGLYGPQLLAKAPASDLGRANRHAAPRRCSLTTAVWRPHSCLRVSILSRPVFELSLISFCGRGKTTPDGNFVRGSVQFVGPLRCLCGLGVRNRRVFDRPGTVCFELASFANMRALRSFSHWIMLLLYQIETQYTQVHATFTNADLDNCDGIKNAAGNGAITGKYPCETHVCMCNPGKRVFPPL